MPPEQKVMDTVGFYEFSVLLFLPDESPSGLRASLRLREGVLEFKAPGVWITLLANQVRLQRGGFNGRQWRMVWHTERGTAMLTGLDDLLVLQRIAPPPLADRIGKAIGHRDHRHWGLQTLLWLLIAALVVLVLLLQWWG